MVTPSPGSFFDQLFDKVGQVLQPPDWMVHEAQRRLVLVLNHVLQQEPQAQERLRRQAGRVVEAQWRVFHMRLQATPAGLLDLGPASAQPDLVLTITEGSPWSLAQAALRGDKPPVRIEGDVQLAAEVQWLVDHVRWDLEEDLSRIFGDAPAHAMGQAGRRMADALRQFVGMVSPGAAASAASPGGASGAGAAAPSAAGGAAPFVPPGAMNGSAAVPPGASGAAPFASPTAAAAGPYPTGSAGQSAATGAAAAPGTTASAGATTPGASGTAPFVPPGPTVAPGAAAAPMPGSAIPPEAAPGQAGG